MAEGIIALSFFRRPSVPVPPNSERVTINISGLKFDVRISTLGRYPQTLLGNADRRKQYYDPETREYFFERDRNAFVAVLSYYQNGGVIERPGNIEFEDHLAEVQFFELGDHAMNQFFEQEHFLTKRREMPKGLLKQKVWRLFEDPKSSWPATLLSWFNFLVAFLSIVAFCIQTIPGVQDLELYQELQIHQNDSEYVVSKYVSMTFNNPFFGIESACVCWICMDLTIRFIVSTKKHLFFFEFHNVVDVLSIVPYLIVVILVWYSVSAIINASAVLTILRIFRVVKFFRMFRITRQWRLMQGFVYTVRASLVEIGLLMFLLMISTVIFASAAFYAEQDQPETKYTSVPETFYWSIITMTSTGYGDISPKTYAGQIIACLCTVVGLITFNLSIPTVARKFEVILQRLKDAERIQAALRKSGVVLEQKSLKVEQAGLGGEVTIYSQHRRKSVHEIVNENRSL